MSSQNVLVSVIVPVYNVEKYLIRCVESLLTQSYRNLEIILVNDGSQDNSGQICDSFKALDQRVVVVHKMNGGLSSARNAGLDTASGKYVSFIDGDDYITPTMIENMVRLMEEHNCQISITGRFDKYEATGKEIPHFQKESETFYTREEAVRELLLRKNIDVSVCDKIFISSLFDKIRFPVGETNEDCAVVFDVFGNASRIVHTDSCDYYYCHRQGSISTTMSAKAIDDMLKHSERVLELVRKDYPSFIREAKTFLDVSYVIAYTNMAKKTVVYKSSLQPDKSMYLRVKNYLLEKCSIFQRDMALTQKMIVFLAKTRLYNLVLLLKCKIKGEL